MTIDIKNLQETLCQWMCEEIKLLSINNRIVIRVPFYFSDGDAYLLYLEELSKGMLKITDAGHTLMHLSYEHNIDTLFKGNRGELFKEALHENYVHENNGELFTETSPKEIGYAVFRFTQALIKINNIVFSKHRQKSTFYNDLENTLFSFLPHEKIKKNYTAEKEIKKAKNYPIDFKIIINITPVFLFGIHDSAKARLTTAILEHLLRYSVKFYPMLVFLDQSIIPEIDIDRLEETGSEMIPSLDQEVLPEIIMSKAA